MKYMDEMILPHSYVLEKLEQLNEKIENMSLDDIDQLAHEYVDSNSHIHSAEFLRAT
jgi:hypothetical protein